MPRNCARLMTMPNAPEKKDGLSPAPAEAPVEPSPMPDSGEPFDLVLVHGETADGEGARVLRARRHRARAAAQLGLDEPLRAPSPRGRGGVICVETGRARRRDEEPYSCTVTIPDGGIAKGSAKNTTLLTRGVEVR